MSRGLGEHELMWVGSGPESREFDDLRAGRAYCRCGWVTTQGMTDADQRFRFIDHLHDLRRAEK